MGELAYSSVRSDMGGGEIAAPAPSTPEAGGRAGPTLISCSTQESNLYFSPIQHSGVGVRTNPEDVKVGEVALPLASCCKEVN